MMSKSSTTFAVLCLLWVSMTSIECRRRSNREVLKRIEIKTDSILAASKIVTIHNKSPSEVSGTYSLTSCTNFPDSPYPYQVAKSKKFTKRLGPNEPAACQVIEISGSNSDGNCITYNPP